MAKGASDSIRRLREEAYAHDAAERQRATMDRMLAIPEVKALVHQPMAPGARLVAAAKEAAAVAKDTATERHPSWTPVADPYKGYADKEKRKAYMREWMRKKRAAARERPLTG